MTLKTLFIFAIGFAAGFVGSDALHKHIETEVASRLDDRKVLQQAGYIQEFVDSNQFSMVGE